MLHKFVLLGLVFVLVLPAGKNCAAQSAKPRKPASTTVSDHVAWNPSMESKLGISKDEFQKMGLANLSKGQLVELFGWSINAQEKAAQNVRATTTTYSCAPYDLTSNKVKIL